MSETIFTKRGKEIYVNMEILFLQELSSKINRIGRNLAHAENGLISHYRVSYGEICTLFDFIQASLNCDRRDSERISLYLQIANKLQNIDIQEGTKYLRKAMRMCLKIIRKNRLLFGEKTKGLSFRKFIDSEIGMIK